MRPCADRCFSFRFHLFSASLPPLRRTVFPLAALPPLLDGVGVGQHFDRPQPSAPQAKHVSHKMSSPDQRWGAPRIHWTNATATVAAALQVGAVGKTCMGKEIAA